MGGRAEESNAAFGCEQTRDLSLTEGVGILLSFP